MLKNYFKIAARNLKRNLSFSFINIFGLATGFACCLLISGFLFDELSYDQFPAHAKDIYRVELNVENKDFYSATDIAVGRGMKENFPEIIDFSRLTTWRNVFVKYEHNQFKESLAFVDSNFLSLFNIPLIQGDMHTALKEPNTVVLSGEAATKYFGKNNPIGKRLYVNNMTDPFTVRGVTGKSPGNLHFAFDVYVKLPDNSDRQTWSNVGTYTYIKLKPGTDPKKLEAKFPQLVAKYVVPEVQHDMGISLAEAQKSVNTFIFYLKPIEKIHLYSANKDELAVNGSIKYVYIFAALAFFILLLAAVNFTNLSTAASVKRAKEVGIRKVLGSEKKQLMLQFLTESVLLSVCSFLIALGIVFLALPYFNQLSGKLISFSFFFEYKNLLAALGFVFLTGIFAGLYPAFFLSSFSILKVLKGKTNIADRGSRNLRSGLVVFQFAISISLMIATIIVYTQLHFMQNKKLGFDKEQALIINDTYLLGANEKPFKEALIKDSRVVNATISNSVPVGTANIDGTQAFAKDNAVTNNHAEIHVNRYHIDQDYLPTLGIQVLEGRNFSPAYITDSTAVILNETAVNAFGIKSNPIGKTIVCSGQQEYHIIAVVKDFHYTSVKDKIAPLVMMMGNNGGGIIVKVKTADITSLLNIAKYKWENLNATGPFSYAFLDEKFASVYADETKTGKIFTLFASISVIIAALGLFGLSAFTIQQRTKEIGVRKVLGASVQNVVLLLSKEFLQMVMIAFLVAVPVTWFTMHKWLEEFAYRINISWWIFLLAGLAALFIGFVTVSFQAIKAAIANPVKSLRTE